MSAGGDSQARTISVLVGENTRMHSQLLADAISHDRGLRIVGAVSTPGEFMTIAARRKPDVAVLSAYLGEDLACGLGTLRQFHAEHQQIPIIVLLDSSRRELVLEAFRCGARGIFSKNESLEQLRKCVRSVHQGQVWANSSEVRFALDALSSAPTIRAVDARGFEILSARELEVVQHLAEGMTNRGIGERMGLSPHTIKNYVLRIFEKLGVSNRVELLKLTLLTPVAQRKVALRAAHSESPTASLLWCQRVAEKGAPYAQLLLAELYRQGEVVPRDLAAAYYWYCLCEKTNPEIFVQARGERERVAAGLTPEQIALVHGKLIQSLPTIVGPIKPARDSDQTREAKTIPPTRIAFGD